MSGNRVTIPEELVQAAAEALRDLPVPLHGWRHRMAEAALEAAFAKLPECEVAVEAASRAECPAPDTKHAHHVECLDLARSHLRALAREFGGEVGR